MKFDELTKLKKLFYWLSFDIEISRKEINNILLIPDDCFHWNPVYEAIKHEINSNGLNASNKSKIIEYLRFLLREFAPIYINNEDCTEERKYILDHVSKSNNAYKEVKTDYEDYVIFTFVVWKEILNIVIEYCKGNDIQISENTDEFGMKHIDFPIPENSPNLGSKNKLKVKQIALIHIYEKKHITRENANEIASNYGYKSGEGLFQDYTLYRSLANRKGKTTVFTKKKMENKIQLFESVVEYLSNEAQSWAKDEIKILKNLLVEFD